MKQQLRRKRGTSYPIKGNYTIFIGNMFSSHILKKSQSKTTKTDFLPGLIKLTEKTDDIK